MRTSTIAILAMAMIMAIGTMASAQNLAVNGNFESWAGTAIGDNWTYYWGGSSTNDTASYGLKSSAWAGIAPTPKFYDTEGQFIAAVYKGKIYSHAGVGQTINVTPGQRYQITAKMACTQVGIADNIRYAWLGAYNGTLWRPDYTLFNETVNTNWAAGVYVTDGWQTRTMEFIPSGPTMTVFLDNYHRSSSTQSTKQSYAFFDDVTVTAIPEPATFVALLSGLPILGFAIRRRKA